MRWFEVNDTSEALTIVLDFENSKALRGELGNEFKAKEYSYIAAIDEQRPLDAERVCRYFTDEMDTGRLYRMGRNKKFVFLFYMDYTKLCQGWPDEMSEFAEQMERWIGPPQADSLLFLYFIRYDRMNRNENAAREAASALGEFVDRHIKGGNKACFCLYRGVMEQWHSQIRGMVRLVYMMSRKTQEDFNSIGPLSNTLNGIAYEEYDEKEAARWDEKIKEITHKLDEHQDPGLNVLVEKSVQMAEEVLQECRKCLQDFDEKRGLFPQSIRDYRGLIFKKFFGTENPDIVQKRVTVAELVMKNDLREREVKGDFSTIEREMTFLDMDEAIGSIKNVCLRVLNDLQRMNDIYTDPQLSLIGECWVEPFLDKILEILHQALEEGRKKAEEEKADFLNKREKAGKYKDVSDCLKSLRDDMGYRFPSYLRPLYEKRWMMVNSEVSTAWEQRGYEAMGMDNETIFVTNIYPWQVQLLMVGRYAEAEHRDTGDNVCGIFGVRRDEIDASEKKD